MDKEHVITSHEHCEGEDEAEIESELHDDKENENKYNSIKIDTEDADKEDTDEEGVNVVKEAKEVEDEQISEINEKHGDEDIERITIINESTIDEDIDDVIQHENSGDLENNDDEALEDIITLYEIKEDEILIEKNEKDDNKNIELVSIINKDIKDDNIEDLIRLNSNKEDKDIKDINTINEDEDALISIFQNFTISDSKIIEDEMDEEIIIESNENLEDKDEIESEMRKKCIDKDIITAINRKENEENTEDLMKSNEKKEAREDLIEINEKTEDEIESEMKEKNGDESITNITGMNEDKDNTDIEDLITSNENKDTDIDISEHIIAATTVNKEDEHMEDVIDESKVDEFIAHINNSDDEIYIDDSNTSNEDVEAGNIDEVIEINKNEVDLEEIVPFENSELKEDADAEDVSNINDAEECKDDDDDDDADDINSLIQSGESSIDKDELISKINKQDDLEDIHDINGNEESALDTSELNDRNADKEDVSDTSEKEIIEEDEIKEVMSDDVKQVEEEEEDMKGKSSSSSEPEKSKKSDLKLKDQLKQMKQTHDAAITELTNSYAARLMESESRTVKAISEMQSYTRDERSDHQNEMDELKLANQKALEDIALQYESNNSDKEKKTSSENEKNLTLIGKLRSEIELLYLDRVSEVGEDTYDGTTQESNLTSTDEITIKINDTYDNHQINNNERLREEIDERNNSLERMRSELKNSNQQREDYETTCKKLMLALTNTLEMYVRCESTLNASDGAASLEPTDNLVARKMAADIRAAGDGPLVSEDGDDDEGGGEGGVALLNISVDDSAVDCTQYEIDEGIEHSTSSQLHDLINGLQENHLFGADIVLLEKALADSLQKHGDCLVKKLNSNIEELESTKGKLKKSEKERNAFESELILANKHLMQNIDLGDSMSSAQDVTVYPEIASHVEILTKRNHDLEKQVSLDTSLHIEQMEVMKEKFIINEEKYNKEVLDLTLQFEHSSNMLNSSKKFIEEQAHDRQLERDELHKKENELKDINKKLDLFIMKEKSYENMDTCELSEIKEKMINMENKFKKNKEMQKDDYDFKISTLQQELAEVSRSLDVVKSENFTRVDELKLDLNDKKYEIVNLSSNIEEINKDNKGLKCEVNSLKSEISDLNLKSRSLTSYNELSNQIEVMNMHLTNEREITEQYSQSESRLKSEIVDLNDKLTKIPQVDEYREQIDTLSNQITENESKFERFYKARDVEVMSLHSVITSLKEQISGIDDLVKRTEAENINLNEYKVKAAGAIGFSLEIERLNSEKICLLNDSIEHFNDRELMKCKLERSEKERQVLLEELSKLGHLCEEHAVDHQCELDQSRHFAENFGSDLHMRLHEVETEHTQSESIHQNLVKHMKMKYTTLTREAQHKHDLEMKALIDEHSRNLEEMRTTRYEFNTTGDNDDSMIEVLNKVKSQVKNNEALDDKLLTYLNISISSKDDAKDSSLRSLLRKINSEGLKTLSPTELRLLKSYGDTGRMDSVKERCQQILDSSSSCGDEVTRLRAQLRETEARHEINERTVEVKHGTELMKHRYDVEMLEYKIFQERQKNEDLRSSLAEEKLFIEQFNDITTSSSLEDQKNRNKQLQGKLDIEISLNRQIEVERQSFKQSLERADENISKLRKELHEEKTYAENVCEENAALSTNRLRRQARYDALEAELADCKRAAVTVTSQLLALRMQVDAQRDQVVTSDSVLEKERALTEKLKLAIQSERDTQNQITQKEKLVINNLEELLYKERMKLSDTKLLLQNESHRLCATAERLAAVQHSNDALRRTEAAKVQTLNSEITSLNREISIVKVKYTTERLSDEQDDRLHYPQSPYSPSTTPTPTMGSSYLSNGGDSSLPDTAYTAVATRRMNNDRYARNVLEESQQNLRNGTGELRRNILKLKSELTFCTMRNYEMKVERRTMTAHMDTAKSDADLNRLKMQRLYNKYLKSESFRKSLIWQKKYLLILIGGYRDSEQQTLSALSRINGGGAEGVAPTAALLNPCHRYRCSDNPKEFFKSRVMVLIAISRLRFTVNKWRRVNYKPSSSAHEPSPGIVSYSTSECSEPSDINENNELETYNKRLSSLKRSLSKSKKPSKYT